MVARRAHNPKVVGSNPAPATKYLALDFIEGFFISAIFQIEAFFMNNVLTVSQLNYSVRHLLEVEFGQVWLTGEISNFSQPVSGHWYLTLKDQHAQVRCAMFKMKNLRVNFKPQNGMQVLVRASVSLYEPRGDYQVIIESMQPAGEGLLQQQFEQLKMKLAAQGLFAQEHKKPIPVFAKRVGIITSSSGAALQDILHVLARRDPSLSVIIYPTQVQGKEAIDEIVSTIQLANIRQECDVLIVGRGGGSLEDLWCFNEEKVAYAIYHSNIPIISAVGHETDVTIADFVADLRAPTPSAAAELVSRDCQELIRQLQHQFDKVGLAFDRIWSDKTTQLSQLTLRLNAQHPNQRLAWQKQQLHQLTNRMNLAMQQRIAHQSLKLNQLKQRAEIQHPVKQLAEKAQALKRLNSRLDLQIQQYWQNINQQWQSMLERFERNPLPMQVHKKQQYQQQLAYRLQYAIEKSWMQANSQFKALCAQVDGLSPLKILSRGYSVTQVENGEVLTSTKQVQKGDRLSTRLAEGQVISEVVEIVS